MMSLFLLLTGASADASAASVQTCARSTSSEILVCGTRKGDSPYRMPKIAKDYGPKPVKAEAQLMPGLVADAHVESQALPGAISKRAMITLKLKF
jgi:hypothetical protein